MNDYFEDFNEGPRGWHAWISNADGPGKLDMRDGVVHCQSPWWVDYNHAPPGGTGYLHLLMGIRTHERRFARHADEILVLAGANGFVQQGCPTDFRNATVTVRLRGNVDLRGANLVYHVQSRVGDRWINYALTGQPFCITPDWSEQSVELRPDPAIWTCLGARIDRGDFYGEAPIEEVLRDLNGNMILILYPLNIAPRHPPMDREKMHALRAGEDYELDRSKLPGGFIMFDWVRISFGR